MKHPELSGGNGAGRGSAGGNRSGAGNSNAGNAGGSAQRAAGETGVDEASGTAAKKSSQDGRAHQKKLKFSFKEQREWDTIEDCLLYTSHESEDEGAEVMQINTMISQLAGGMLVSTEIFVVTLVFSLPLGLLIAFGRMSKNKVLQAIVKTYISIMRGTPPVSYTHLDVYKRQTLNRRIAELRK